MKLHGTITALPNSYNREIISFMLKYSFYAILIIFASMKNRKARLSGLSLVEIPCWWYGNVSRYVSHS